MQRTPHSAAAATVKAVMVLCDEWGKVLGGGPVRQVGSDCGAAVLGEIFFFSILHVVFMDEKNVKTNHRPPLGEATMSVFWIGLSEIILCQYSK